MLYFLKKTNTCDLHTVPEIECDRMKLVIMGQLGQFLTKVKIEKNWKKLLKVS